MTVGELIEKLKEYDTNMSVHLQYMDGGGYYHGDQEIEEIVIVKDEEDGSKYALVL